MGVIDDPFSVIFFEQLRVNFLLGRFELVSDIILLANENELTRRGVVFVSKKVMHPEPEIIQIELAEVFARDRERIKIVLLEILPEFSAPLLVFSPDETGGQEKRRGNDRRDHV